MPIRLNLLAEAQADEELRRRDPVKRAIWISGFIVALVFGLIGYLQWRIISANHLFDKLEANLSLQTNQYVQVISNQRKLTEVSQKLASLNQLATNRFLWANLLNTLQQTTVDDIQLLRLRTEQKSELFPEAKGKTNELGKLIEKAKPAAASEKIVLTFDAKDTSSNPGGEQINKFKEAIAKSPLFLAALGKTNQIKLRSLSTPQIDPEVGRPSVVFTLEAAFPEKVR